MLDMGDYMCTACRLTKMPEKYQIEEDLQIIVHSALKNVEVLTTLYLSINHTLDCTNLDTLNITKLKVAAETT